MGRVAYADESGTHGSTKCYGIGVVSLEEERLPAFEERFAELKAKHNVAGELKWEAIRNRYSDINLVLDWLHHILASRTARLDVMVVNTALYRNWSERGSDRETAFYKTYTQLLKSTARKAGKITKVFIDDRSDAYAKQHEAMEIIGNHMLVQLASDGRLGAVTKVPSDLTPGVQVADVLTGLIVAGHSLVLNESYALNKGKRLAVDRAARMLGWDRLCYDTMPGSKLNIWHFPVEYRAKPRTREVVRARRAEQVTRQDLE